MSAAWERKQLPILPAARQLERPWQCSTAVLPACKLALLHAVMAAACMACAGKGSALRLAMARRVCERVLSAKNTMLAFSDKAM